MAQNPQSKHKGLANFWRPQFFVSVFNFLARKIVLTAIICPDFLKFEWNTLLSIWKSGPQNWKYNSASIRDNAG